MTANKSDAYNCPTSEGVSSEVTGDYDGIACDNRYVWFSWSDGRRFSTNHITPTQSIVRNQTDIRCVKISWPKVY